MKRRRFVLVDASIQYTPFRFVSGFLSLLPPSLKIDTAPELTVPVMVFGFATRESPDFEEKREDEEEEEKEQAYNDWPNTAGVSDPLLISALCLPPNS